MSDEFKDLNILIFVKDPENLTSAVRFLVRRGLKLEVAQGTKEAIEYTISKNPKYVFLSWNAPFKTVKLKQIFEETFRAKVVVFAELSDSRTAAQLSVSGLNETMSAPVSGPGILMRIKAMEQEEKEELEFNVRSKEQKDVSFACPAKALPNKGRWERCKNEQNIWYFKSKQKIKMFGFEGKIKYRGDEPPQKDENSGWKANERFLSFEVDQEKVKQQNAQKEAQEKEKLAKERKEQAKKEEFKKRKEEALKREEGERHRKDELRKKQAFEREIARKRREEYLEKRRLENKLRAEIRKKSYGKVKYTKGKSTYKHEKECSIKYQRASAKNDFGNLSMFEGGRTASRSYVNKGLKGVGQNYLHKGNKNSSSLMLDKGWEGDAGSNYMSKGTQQTGSNYMNKGTQQTGSNYMDKGTQQTGSNYMDKGTQQTGSNYMSKGTQQTGSNYMDKNKNKDSLYMEEGRPERSGPIDKPVEKESNAGHVYKKNNKEQSPGKVEKKQNAQKVEQQSEGKAGGIYDKTGAIPRGETLNEGKEFSKLVEKNFKTQVCKAIDETCQESDFPRPLNQVEKIHCLILETQTHRGFLILTSSNFIDESFVEKLKQNIGHTLIEIHDLVVSLEVIDMKTKGLKFKQWAFEKAHFQYFSSHKEAEIGVCYFDARDVFSQLTSPCGGEMEPISVEKIPHNNIIDMDLYIFLNKNNKYLRYIRKNGNLSKEQKQKILKSSITNFYINSGDLRAYKRMISRLYLEKLLETKDDDETSGDKNKVA